AGVIASPGTQRLPIRREGEGRAKCERAAELMQLFAGRHVPEADRQIAVLAGGSQELAVGRKGERTDPADVALQGADLPTAGRLQGAAGAVAAAGGNKFAVGRPGEAEDFAAVAGESAFLAGGRVEELDHAAVDAAGGQEHPGRGKAGAVVLVRLAADDV